MLYGGIYGYPGDVKNKNGKLRLLYECAPMSMIAEQARTPETASADATSAWTYTLQKLLVTSIVCDNRHEPRVAVWVLPA
jgi:fructose-1,6-bisphosphatase